MPYPLAIHWGGSRTDEGLPMIWVRKKHKHSERTNIKSLKALWHLGVHLTGRYLIFNNQFNHSSKRLFFMGPKSYLHKGCQIFRWSVYRLWNGYGTAIGMTYNSCDLATPRVLSDTFPHLTSLRDIFMDDISGKMR